LSKQQTILSHEKVVRAVNGWMALLSLLVLLIADVAYLCLYKPGGLLLLSGWVVLLGGLGLMKGFFILQPNEARVLILFGAYVGTVRTSGFHWANPLLGDGGQGRKIGERIVGIDWAKIRPSSAGPTGRSVGRNKLSLRARTMNGQVLKVNDKRGNPIEIAAVVVWRIEDTAQALFDVDDYETFVPIQSESALRHLANMYTYDDGDGTETTLRSNVDEVSQALKVELQERLTKAGVTVDEARLTHLAYAPEIAQVMLRRQQAEAVIAARQKIVHGAVSMVDMALRELADKDVVQLDDERRAAMVSNLMVVLCSESEVHPVVNAGTLYS
jgi:regulator of protease activity HflC (stomatin/prohibitin superfamily)